MRLFLQFAAILGLAVMPLSAEQEKTAKEPARPFAGGRALKNGGARNGFPKKGPRLVNPNSPAARLFQASPEERERAIEKFPPARQEAIRRNLDWFDHLPRPQQQMVLRGAERLANLSPERQRAFQQQWQALQRLPQERKVAVGMALRRLQVMSDDQRVRILESEQFRNRFSPEEQKIISGLSDVMLPPM